MKVGYQEYAEALRSRISEAVGIGCYGFSVYSVGERFLKDTGACKDATEFKKGRILLR